MFLGEQGVRSPLARSSREVRPFKIKSSRERPTTGSDLGFFFAFVEYELEGCAPSADPDEELSLWRIWRPVQKPKTLQKLRARRSNLDYAGAGNNTGSPAPVRASKPRVTAKTAKICLSSALSSGKLFYQKLLHEEKKKETQSACRPRWAQTKNAGRRASDQ